MQIIIKQTSTRFSVFHFAISIAKYHIHIWEYITHEVYITKKGTEKTVPFLTIHMLVAISTRANTDYARCFRHTKPADNGPFHSVQHR